MRILDPEAAFRAGLNLSVSVTAAVADFTTLWFAVGARRATLRGRWMHDEFWHAWAELQRVVQLPLHVEPPLAGACASWDTCVGVNTAMDCVAYAGDAGTEVALPERQAGVSTRGLTRLHDEEVGVPMVRRIRVQPGWSAHAAAVLANGTEGEQSWLTGHLTDDDPTSVRVVYVPGRRVLGGGHFGSVHEAHARWPAAGPAPAVRCALKAVVGESWSAEDGRFQQAHAAKEVDIHARLARAPNILRLLGAGNETCTRARGKTCRWKARPYKSGGGKRASSSARNDPRTSTLAKLARPWMASMDGKERVRKVSTVESYDSVAFLLLEYAPGGTLNTAIGTLRLELSVRRLPLPEQLLKALMQQLSAGLAALHDIHVAHIDLSPFNVVLTEPVTSEWVTDPDLKLRPDLLKLIDLGASDKPKPISMQRPMPDGDFLDFRAADVFSAGCVLRDLLELTALKALDIPLRSRVPFPGGAGTARFLSLPRNRGVLLNTTRRAEHAAQVKAHVGALRSVHPTLSAGLWDLLARLLAAESSERRFRTARDVLASAYFQ